MARDLSTGPVSDPPSVADRVAAARAVVYDDAGELIGPEQIEDALAEAGVTVSENDDGTPSYRDVPPALSLTACYLAVDLRDDPAEFFVDGR